MELLKDVLVGAVCLGAFNIFIFWMLCKVLAN
jgi:hypothetical protein